jgi:hypothetical protein
MSAIRNYMPLTIAMRQEMSASDALATYDEYQARLMEISTEVEALLSVPLDIRDDATASPTGCSSTSATPSTTER